MKIRKSWKAGIYYFCVLSVLRVIQSYRFQTKMEKKKGKVDDVKDEKEEGEKKEDETPTPSVGLFELVRRNFPLNFPFPFFS